MSIWWFNRLDGRGPYTLFQSLKEQINAIRYVAKTGSLLKLMFLIISLFAVLMILPILSPPI